MHAVLIWNPHEVGTVVTVMTPCHWAIMHLASPELGFEPKQYGSRIYAPRNSPTLGSSHESDLGSISCDVQASSK
jgi:hypothetical protein